jgi:GT2 family glycosyltransferase
MTCLHFVSLEDRNSDRSFDNEVKSLLYQNNANWQWSIDEVQFNKLRSLKLKRKIRSDKRITILNLSNELDRLDTSRNWGIVILHNGFSLAKNFVDVVEEIKLTKSFDLLYSDIQLIDEDNKNLGIWRRPRNCTERLMHHNYVSGALVIQEGIFSRVRAGGISALNEIENRAICDVLLSEGTFQHVIEPITRARRDIVMEQMDAPSQQWLEETSKVATGKKLNFVSVQGPTGNWVKRRTAKEKFSVSIVIPTRGDKKIVWGIETDLLENVVGSLFQRTDNNEFEVIVVHDVNNAYYEHADSLAHYGNRVRLVPYVKPFNFADKCNLGALQSSAQVVVFLNDDVEVIDPWWLDHLLGYLESDEVGAVGPVLLLENGMVQSAGHVNEPFPANYFSGKPLGFRDFPEALDIPCEVSGLTAACLAIRRELFDEVGGFCEALPNNFNDVDLCSKIQHSGRSLIWTPLAKLYHFESVTRVATVTQEEVQFIRDRWGRTFETDPYRSRIE